MSHTVPNYRWSISEFVRAWEAGAFDHRVELIEGELWPVVIGDWHGKMVGNVIGALFQAGGGIVTCSTLPSAGSMPDPDCWVLRDGAQPADEVSPPLSRWDPADVLLVVEISVEAVLADLTTKARIYGSAGYSVYWVVTPEAIFEHTGPMASGYRSRTEYVRGESLPLSYAGTELAVDSLLLSEA